MKWMFRRLKWVMVAGMVWGVHAKGDMVATGGTVSDIVVSGVTYRVHCFTNAGTDTFKVWAGESQVEYLLVGGGGGGGGVIGGGGGAGGICTGACLMTPGSYPITVGSGGGGGTGWNTSTQQGNRGGDSSFNSIIALGGGGGGPHGGSTVFDPDQAKGGSGGGGGLAGMGYGTPEQGYDGGMGGNENNGGGGGGASEAGQAGQNSVRAGNGGSGISNAIAGTWSYYGGGGGGGSRNGYGPAGIGGRGGGGAGTSNSTRASDGAANTGGGGGGGGLSQLYHRGTGRDGWQRDCRCAVLRSVIRYQRPGDGFTHRRGRGRSDGGVFGGGRERGDGGGGWYTHFVPAGWSGTITPSYPCGIFQPDSRTCTNLAESQMDMNYEAILTTPGTFELQGPTNGFVAIDVARFEWGASDCAVGYDVYTGDEGEEERVATVGDSAFTWSCPIEGTQHWYVVARNAAGSVRAPETGTWSFIGCQSTLLTGNVTIAQDDFSYDHKPLLKDGGTLTLDGSHTFANLILTNGAVLTHPACTAAETHGLDLTIHGALMVSSDSAIDAGGRGYLAGWTHPNTTNGASTYRSGGSYGGLGGNYPSGRVNAPYGDFRNPNEPGSGAYLYGAGGGNRAGGGLVRIVTGSLELEGAIRANGQDGDYGRGSGGGIYLEVGRLSGGGIVEAVGGRNTADVSSYFGGSGGGGRIAIYYDELDGFDLSNRVSAAGGKGESTSSYDGAAGTVYLVDQLAPVRFVRFSPDGLTNTAVSEMAIRVGSPLAPDTFTLADVALRDPQGALVSLASLSAMTTYDYLLLFSAPVSEEGEYELTIGTNIISVLGEYPELATTHSFVIDTTPPGAPVVTNRPGIPATNCLRATAAVLSGTREDGSAVWVNGAMRVPWGVGAWVCTQSFSQGATVLDIYATDAAGNRSATNGYAFLADTVAPAVTAVSPANGSWATAAPAFVRLTYVEAASGLDTQRSTYAVKISGLTLPGSWAVTTNTLTFTPEGTMLDGSYAVSARLYDNMANTGAVFSSSFIVDTTPPGAPGVSGVTSPTTINQQTITGTREADTAILCNGTQVVASGSSTNWSYAQALTNGWNYFAFTARDAAGNMSEATDVAILYNDVAPEAVTVTGAVYGVGTRLTLGWAGYNELAAGGDIATYHVFQSADSFTHVSAAEQIGTRGAGQKSFVVTGLVRNVTKHYAVMARDTTGLADSNVTSVALAPVDVIAPPNPTGAVFACGATNLTLTWSASADPDADLAGYRLYVTNAATGLEYGLTNRLHEQDGLVPSSSYVFRVSAYDVTGNEGAGLVVTGYTVLPNPTGLTVTPYDGYVEMSWNGVQPSTYVKHYAIYAYTNEYSSVSGLTARLTVTKTNASLAGFQNGVTNWFAVTTVNPSGGQNPEVAPVAAMTEDDVMGPLMWNLRFNGAALNSAATKPGSFTVNARDPAGMSRVEFRVNGALVGTATGSSTNFAAFWNVTATTNDGLHAVELTGYDTLGNTRVWATNIPVALAKPEALILTQPVGTSTVNRPRQPVTGTGAVYVTQVVLSRNGTEVAGETVSVSGAGGFSGGVDLLEGTNAIRAAGVNRAGTGTWSQAGTVILDTSIPATPAGLTATPREGGAIRLSWSDPQGVNVKGYQVYRAASPFTATGAATRVNSALVAVSYYTDLPPSDGLYYYRVAAVNRADTEGWLSEGASSRSDRTAPRVMAVTYQSDGPSVPTENRYGYGRVQVSLALSEPLVTAPFFSLNPVGGVPIAVMLQSGGTNEYTGYFNVDGSRPCGPAYAVFSGRDLAGNRGTAIETGDVVTLDTCGPVVSELHVTPVAPIANPAGSPTTVTVVAVFATNEVPVGTPELSWSLETTRTQETAVALSPLTYRSWGGSFALPSNGGNPAEHLRFQYRGVDDLGNTGATIQVESRFQVYQGSLPPYEAPQNLTGRAQPGGAVELSWSAVTAAADYVLYKGSASNALMDLARSGGLLTYTDAAGDATNWYAVASVREANGQAVTSAWGQVVRVVSDATPPAAPEGLVLKLLGNGVLLSWTAVPEETVKYQAYRDTQTIVEIGSRPAFATNVSSTNAVDAKPVKGAAYYAVAAVDSAGNRSAPSLNAYTNLALLPVNGLGVEHVAGQRPTVAWSHANATAIDGFRIYEGEQLLADGLANTATSYVDTAYSSGGRLYGLVAVDEVGGETLESVRRTLRLPDLSVSLPANALLKRGVMNRLLYTVTNAAAAVTNARLKVRTAGIDHVSELFSLGAGETGCVAVVVGGYTNLPPVATLSNMVELLPHEGEWVRLRSAATVNVSDEVLTAEVHNDELTRGTEGKVRFVLHNTSAEEIEVVLAQKGGASPEVRVKLETPEGMVLSAGAAKQLLGAGVMTLANGQTVARIPAGTSFSSSDILLTIPTNAPNAAVLRLEIDRLHYHLGQEDHVQIAGVQSTRAVSLQETIYSAAVTNIHPASSMGDTNILIQGHAVNRTTGAGQADVPVKLTVSLEGFERTYTVYADAGGHWNYNFEPLANEGGVYKVWAVHPLRVDKPVQGEFAINRVGVSPATVSGTLPMEYPQAVKITVSTSKGLTLTNLHLRYEASNQPGGILPAGVHIEPGATTATLAGGSRATLRFTIWGESPATTGSVVLVVADDVSGPSGWGRVTVNYRFTEAQPALTWSPNYVQTGVAVSNRVTETVKLKNNGYGALADVGVSLWTTNGTAAPEWVQLNVASNLGNLAIGEEWLVDITFAPTNSASLGQHQFILRVTAANHATKDINLFVGVDSSGRGGALFKVTDIYTGTTNQSGIVQGLAGARVTLQKESGSTVETNRTTDSLGEAYFEDLPVGSYMYRVTANRHEATSGRLWVKPGVIGNTEVFLNSPLVTVEWSVVPTTIEDEYNIVLTATFETQVPAPVVLLEPVSVQLPEMAVGDVFNGEFTMKNYGLIRAEAIQIQIPESDEYYKYELMVEPPETLEAHQVVRIPYRVTCLKVFGADDAASGGGAACGCYSRCASYSYGYYCINGHWESVVRCSHWCGRCISCGSSTKPSYGPTGIVNVGLGGAGGGSSGGPGGSSLPGGSLGCAPMPNPEEDPCAPLEPVGSSVVLAGGGYHDEAVDIEIHTLGDLLYVRRYYFNGTWVFEDLAQNLEYVADGIKVNGTLLSGLNQGSSKINVDLSPGARFYSSAGDVLECQTNGYLMTWTTGNWAWYDTGGRRMARGDRQGRQILYGYDATTSRVAAVYDHFTNQVLWVEYASTGLVSSLRDRLVGGRTVRYTYDAQGRLTNVVGVLGGQTAYRYDAQGRLAQKRAPGGYERNISYRADGAISSILNGSGEGKFFDFSYDEAKGVYYSYMRTSGGQITERWYDQTWMLINTAINGEVVDTSLPPPNPEGATEQFDENGKLVRVDYADGTSQRFEYNGPYQTMTRQVDEAGVVTLYHRDSRGNATSVVEAAGTALERTTLYGYDGLGLLTNMIVVGDGQTADAVVSFAYDEKGNILRMTDTAGYVTRYAYDDLGNTTLISNESGVVWTFAYDAMGHRLTTRDPLGLVESNTYDLAENLVQVRDAGGRVYEYDYDSEGRLTQARDPFGMVQDKEYDADGQCIATRYSDGEVFTASYRWDGQMTSLSDAAGRVNRTEYDAWGRVIKMTVPEGVMAEIEYDEASRPVRMRTPVRERRYAYDSRGAVTAMYCQAGATIITNHFAYDPRGLAISAVDAEGHTGQSEYDVLGRRIKTVDALGRTNLYAYDARDNLVAMTDGLGRTTQFEYDAGNRQTRRRSPDGAKIRIGYDAAGRIAQTVDANGSKVRWDYDGLGRVLTTRVYAVEADPTPAKTVTYTYDAYGRRLSYDDGTTAGVWTYDDAARTTTCAIDYGDFSAAYTYEYDAQGRKIALVGPDGWTNRYRYGSDRLLAEVEISGEGSLSLQRQSHALEQHLQFPGGARQQYSFDPLLGLMSNRAMDATEAPLMQHVYTRSSAGPVRSLETDEGLYTYDYDGVYQLLQAGHPVLGSWGYTYDAAGNRHTSVGPDAGNWQFDLCNRLTNAPAGVFEYDAAGNMVRKTTNGETHIFVYEPAGNLSEIRDGEGQLLAAYYYDPMGRRLRKEVGGVVTWFLYADEGLIAELDADGIPIRQYAYFPDATWNNNPLAVKTGGQVLYYLNDHLGAPRKLVTRNGVVVWSALYEAFGAARVDPASTAENPLRGSGQYYDAESGLHYNTQRYYDPRLGRYIQADPLGEVGGANLYTFALNSPLQYVDPLGLVIVINHRQTATGEDKQYRSTGQWKILPHLWSAAYTGPKENRFDFYISPEDRARLKAQAGKGLTIYVHGYNNDHEDAVTRGQEYENILRKKLSDENFEMVVFSWRGDFGWLNFKGSKAIARDAAESLYRLNRCLQAEGIPVTILAHSLGNYLIGESLFNHGDMELDNWLALQAAVPSRDMTRKGRYGSAIENQVGSLQYTSGRGDKTTGWSIYGLSEGAIGMGNGGVKNAPANVTRIDYAPEEHGDILGKPITDAARDAINRMRQITIDPTLQGQCEILSGGE